MTEKITGQLSAETKGFEPEEILKVVATRFPGKVVFTSSFGYEDQVITDMIFRNNIPIKIVTLDTGRLFEETYKVFARTKEKYRKEIIAFFPESHDIENLLKAKGPISFYESVENRKECCHIRKVIPLSRALNGIDCWVTGLRADQSANRSTMKLFEWDEGQQLVKVNPLLDWNLELVKEYIQKYNVPYNALHDRGFVSIGCEPCTRAIKPGEDFRAGRWWWEQNTGKECGLHEKKD